MKDAVKRPDHTFNHVVDRWLAAIDPVATVRGMSSGFSVLVIGGLVAPLASRVALLGSFVLVLAAVAGFVAAARRPGNSPVPRVFGATAAVGAYLLVLPLVGMATHHWDALQIAVTTASALVVGGIVGELRGRQTSVWARP